MKALLMKDWYLIIRQYKSLLLIDALMFAMAIIVKSEAGFFLAYPCLTSGVVVMTLLSAEELEGWNRCVLTLPVTRAQIVGEKYVFSLLSLLSILAVTAAVLAYVMSGAGISAGEYAARLLMLFSAGLFLPAVLLPCLYRFGINKGRIVFYFVVGAACSAAPFTSLIRRNGAALPSGISALTLSAALTAAAAAAYALSWWLSVRFYNRARG